MGEIDIENEWNTMQKLVDFILSFKFLPLIMTSFIYNKIRYVNDEYHLM